MTTLGINDMFLLSNDPVDIDNCANEDLTGNLFRVQKVSSGNYMFRAHTASTINNKTEEIMIQSIAKLVSYNPIKVIVSSSGNVKKA